MSEVRGSIVNLLSDVLAIQIAARLDEQIRLPAPEMVKELRTATIDRAEKLLTQFEKEMLINTVRDIVVRDVRREFLRRRTAARILDIGINVSAFVAANSNRRIAVCFHRAHELDCHFDILLGTFGDYHISVFR